MTLLLGYAKALCPYGTATGLIAIREGTSSFFASISPVRLRPQEPSGGVGWLPDKYSSSK